MRSRGKSIKPQLILLLALHAAGCVAADKSWQLVWSDEFDYTGVPDPQRWTYESGFVRNKELQYYTDRTQNARVENGRLTIEGRKERHRNSRHEAGSRDWRRSPEFAEYTSASVTTQAKAQWTYGRIEVRAKLPQGRGVWPAIWMLGLNRTNVGWPRCGEIDIMEYVGFQPDLIHANVHTGKYNHVRGTGKGAQIRTEAPYQDFHNYALEWQPDRMDFLLDDKKFFSYAKEPNGGAEVWPFDQPFYLILNLAIGGEWGAREGIDDAIFPQLFEIEYVRVYKKGGAS
jgi:beta-glucanase (GH16 family)